MCMLIYLTNIGGEKKMRSLEKKRNKRFYSIMVLLRSKYTEKSKAFIETDRCFESGRFLVLFEND